MPVILYKIRHLWKSSLHRNAIYLLATRLMTGALGFLFWIICAKLYSSEEIGYATTMLSAINLLAGFSLLGFNIGLVKFIPDYRKKSEIISSCFIISFFIGLILAIGYLIGLDVWSPKLIFMRDNMLTILIFIITVIFISLNELIDSVFLSRGVVKFTFIKNLVLMLIKICLPICLVAYGTYGIFSSWSIAAGIALFIAIIVFLPKAIENIKLKFTVKKNIVSKIFTYSFGNYIALFIWGLPVVLFPLMITNMLEVRMTSYFYLSWTIGALLFMIPGAIASSLFAEGANVPEVLDVNLKKSLKFTFLLLLPAVIVAVFLDNKLLILFGQEYVEQTTGLISVLALSSVPLALTSLYISKLRVIKRIKMIVLLNLISTITTLIIGYILLVQIGLIGTVYGWFIGQSVVLGIVAADRAITKK